MKEIIAAVVGVVLIALFIYLSLRYFRKIGRGEADPVINPGWTTDMRPTTGTELPRREDDAH
ncbi:hypothetical protein [Mycolicibacterium aichiense]|uniref:Uncharacterized protein n=1 Tax=Mycolicibacterium aichiense TaxID=1799 RepID=A0AAD1HQK0_9MYCO|nr:hypothetical protein [Mycolicibacterium aichiense]MCV7016303.1 hypothetical protein [Mycolicibacterium aichiense]BBX09928.1 hypothetical protein MAIC_47310 [Mycolicibacterium aichiense]STZ26407.1 Uncharacterised protein [Mycolicibacterium aichiense]